QLPPARFGAAASAAGCPTSPRRPRSRSVRSCRPGRRAAPASRPRRALQRAPTPERAPGRASSSRAPRSPPGTLRRGRGRRRRRPVRIRPSRRSSARARRVAGSRPRSRGVTRAEAPTCARRAEMHAGARPSSAEGGSELELGGDSRTLALALEPGRESRVRLELDAEVRARPQDPGDIADVGEAVLAAAQVRLRLERRVEVAEALLEPRRLASPQRVVVGTEPDVEAVEPEPAERALLRIGRPEGRLGETLLEVLHDHE